MEQGSSSWFWGLLILALIWWGWSNKNNYEEQLGYLTSCEFELLRTNDRLSEANDAISDAKDYTYESYDDMVWALESLEWSY